MFFQLNEQCDLVEKVTSENIEHLEKQRLLVEEYCGTHMESIDQQIKTNKVNNRSLQHTLAWFPVPRIYVPNTHKNYPQK